MVSRDWQRPIFFLPPRNLVFTPDTIYHKKYPLPFKESNKNQNQTAIKFLLNIV
jgi:hypothetical protein